MGKLSCLWGQAPLKHFLKSSGANIDPIVCQSPNTFWRCIHLRVVEAASPLPLPSPHHSHLLSQTSHFTERFISRKPAFGEEAPKLLLICTEQGSNSFQERKTSLFLLTGKLRVKSDPNPQCIILLCNARFSFIVEAGRVTAEHSSILHLE